MNIEADGVVKIAGRRGLAVLVLALACAFPGCAGYVQGDGGTVVYAQPDLYLFDGGYDDGGRARDYGRRGERSRGHDEGHAPAAARPEGARPAPAAPAAPSAPIVPEGGHEHGGGGKR
jgi:hypothetical protein